MITKNSRSIEREFLLERVISDGLPCDIPVSYTHLVYKRQAEKIENFRKKIWVDYGAFGENLVVEGYDFRNLPVTSRFAIQVMFRACNTQLYQFIFQ